MTRKNIGARVMLSVLFSALVCTAFWLIGFDFDHRGTGAFNVFVWSVLAAIMGGLCPAFDQ
jgi:hypothetical protein